MKQLLSLLTLVLLTIYFSSCSSNGKSNLELPAIITDNMVLQQQADVKIWGWADAGESITITPSWGEAIYIGANDRGQWITDIKTPEAGGPFNLSIEGSDSSITINNVMIGEVWLCSGQSNMEMSLKGWPPKDLIDNSEEEIKSANNPDIRMFTVVKNISPTEEKKLQGSWAVCHPSTVGNFSATAYFFGKKLYEELNIPIGLIHSSWGGTPAESWTSLKHIGNVEGYEKVPQSMSTIISDVEKYNNWLHAMPVHPQKDFTTEDAFVNISFNDSVLSTSSFDDSNWLTMELPIVWEKTEVKAFDGVIWFRKEVEIPPKMMNKNLILSLGPIDDMDVTYFNGVKVGGYERDGFYSTERNYEISKDLVKEGKAVIAVRVIDNRGGGGIWGSKEQLKISAEDNPKNSISLAGEWKYNPVAEFSFNKFYLFGTDSKVYSNRPKVEYQLNPNTPTVLYNAMIAPLVPYTIKGSIWYQGESNVGRAMEYQSLFPTMIKSWRDSWNQGEFPFYFVQIAPYNYISPESSSSAYIRDAQFKSLSTPNTGIATTLDIGNAVNIHPGNKLEVGNRLALWALAKDYAKDIVYSGPIYTSKEIKGNKIVLSFESIGSGLKSSSKNLKGFTIAGKNQKFVKANATIQGDKVVVWSSRIKNPTEVRYSFKNVPEVSLYNNEGLPAPTFRTDNWPE